MQPADTEPLREPYPGCPLCGGTEHKHLGTSDASKYVHYVDALPRDFSWLLCQACSHVHTRHFWTPAGLDILLGRAHKDQLAQHADHELIRRMWAPVIRTVTECLGGAEAVIFDEPRTWLDVGCGNGGLVMTAVEFGYRAIGLDLREETAASLRGYGYECLQGTLEGLSVPQPLDVISLMDVLEHVPFPHATLQAAYDRLRDGGLLVISCPNMETSTWRYLNRAKANPYWLELEHCHNFSRSRLVQLLREHGFTPIHYDVSPRYLSGMDLVCRKGPQG